MSSLFLKNKFNLNVMVLPYLTSKNRFSKKNGVALILTLVILLLISIFMTEFFFETNLETQSIQNFRSSFTARSVVKSMFKAVMVGLQDDEIQFFENLNMLTKMSGMPVNSILNPPAPIPLPEGIVPDFEDVTIFTPYIRPIDHLFNLNRIQNKKGSWFPDHALNRIAFNQFYNILKNIPIEIPQKINTESNEPEFYYLSLDEVRPIYGAIFDWMDKDEKDIYDDGFGQAGAEYAEYQNSDPEIIIKNRQLDRLTEIKLIKGVIECGIPYEIWKKHFTVFDVGVVKNNIYESRLNVNHATTDEIIEYLKRFEQENEYTSLLGSELGSNAKYQDAVNNAKMIAEGLIQYNEEEQRIKYNSIREVENILKSFELDRFAKNLFIVYSNWYEIHLIAEADGIQAEIRAVVRLERDNKGKAKRNSLEIMDFMLR